MQQESGKEYWVNVYPYPNNYVYGPAWSKKPWWKIDHHYGIVGYRIHVKMKVKPKTYKYSAMIPGYYEYIRSNKDWMGN